MGVKLRHVEKLVDVAMGKPLAWALYAGGVVLVILVRATLRGIRWLTQRKGETCPRHS